jgi:hypothetical protein
MSLTRHEDKRSESLVGCFSALLAPYVSSQDTLVDTASPARTALKNGQLTGGETYTYFGDRTLGPVPDVFRRIGIELGNGSFFRRLLYIIDVISNNLIRLRVINHH